MPTNVITGYANKFPNATSALDAATTLCSLSEVKEPKRVHYKINGAITKKSHDKVDKDKKVRVNPALGLPRNGKERWVPTHFEPKSF